MTNDIEARLARLVESIRLSAENARDEWRARADAAWNDAIEAAVMVIYKSNFGVVTHSDVVRAIRALKREAK